MTSQLVLDTPRLHMRELVPLDAAFLLGLLNEPAFLRYIGDRGVRDEAGACGYVERVRAGYAKHGCGLLLVERRADGAPLGICGLIRRDGLDEPDLGFALCAAHEGHGYALEASRAALAHGRDAFGLQRVVAIVAPDNERSKRLLGKLGFAFERTLRMPGESTDVELHAWHA